MDSTEDRTHQVYTIFVVALVLGISQVRFWLCGVSSLCTRVLKGKIKIKPSYSFLITNSS